MSERLTDEELDALERAVSDYVAACAVDDGLDYSNVKVKHAAQRRRNEAAEDMCENAEELLPLLLAEVKRLRAAEQPPTPPSGRGEERERIEEIRKRWKRADGFRVVDSGELFTFVDDLLAAVDSRDAVIARLEKIVGLQQAALERWKECRAQGTYPTAPGPVIE